MHVLRSFLYLEPSTLGERRQREPAFRRVLANATNKPKVCESEGNGMRFAEIRADSWFAFFVINK